MVYYRKYRPQTVSELDLKEVREKLTSILSSKEIPHAFLFTGPRGLGKTSSARILAKAINCKNKKGIEPCNECEICKSITDGNHIDIIEIDAASNRGVDEIRSLREKVKYSPSELEKKVYIIDEVHMLTNEAFNALLKTLEEPPSHAVFILATTEAHKVPQTILSRTFNIKFLHPAEAEVSNSLKRISEGEKLDIETGVYKMIYELSEGSFRDAAKALEELSLNSKDKKITKELVEKMYKNQSSEREAGKLIEKILSKDLNGGLQIIEAMSIEGLDFKIIIEKMVEIIRKNITDNSYEIENAKMLLKLLNEAYGILKFSVVPQLPLELVVMEYCVKSKDIEGKSSADKSLKKPEKEPEIEAKSEKVLKTKASQLENSLLTDLTNVVHERDKRVAAFLRSCKDARVESSTLVLTTPYSIHAKKLMSDEFRQIILECVFDINKNIKLLEVVIS